MKLFTHLVLQFSLKKTRLDLQDHMSQDCSTNGPHKQIRENDLKIIFSHNKIRSLALSSAAKPETHLIAMLQFTLIIHQPPQKQDALLGN
jgi:hypothetical protein